MDGLAPHHTWRFDRFVFDPSNGGLFRLTETGAREPVPIGGRALDVLATLIAHSGELVLKQTILDAVWPGVSVEEKNLTVQISALRRVLDRDRGDESYIQTVPGRGYRFVAPPAEAQDAVTAFPENLVTAPARQHPWTASVTFRALTVLAALGLIVGAFAWLIVGSTPPLAYSPQDRRQSIIVFPFENVSADAAQDDVAASVTREVTDIFARSKNVPLIPAATAATYRGKPIDLRRIGREHDVHFALVGNTRQQDGRLVVSATLYETAHGNQVWAQRFERAEGAAAGSWIVASLIYQEVDQATMDEEVRVAKRDHPRRLDKRDLMFAAYTSNMFQASKAVIEEQIALIDRALALDPDYVWALQAKGRRHADLVLQGFSDDTARDLASAAEAVDRALQRAPNNYLTLKEKTYVLRAQGNWPEAEALTRRLLELRPRVSARHSNLGSILMAEGRHKEALDCLLASKRLQIATDDIPVVDANLAATLLATGRFGEAIAQARLAIPEFTSTNGRIAELPWLVLVAAQSANGQGAEARADLNRFLAIPRTWNTIAALQTVPFLSTNPVLLDGLRDAGMPLR